ncbi:hypothetical protein PRZ48_009180 [Zasmidium cellare]|uniref:Uncharacterized protein n=1 Tax=Zasmidium cellare TaxID=395010 RepID=A0ABR0EBL0_ZASCE|nr:hypothetical protein PRZ48_009180 [Zasmidium cellare]
MRAIKGSTVLNGKQWRSQGSHFYNRVAAKFALTPSRFTAYSLLALFVIIATLYVRNTSSRDPGSWFFDPETAYTQKYSAVRQWQAERFIESGSQTTHLSSGRRPQQIRLYDYTYLLKACYDTEAPYIATIEDDVVAMDGWYHRTIEGIKQAGRDQTQALDFFLTVVTVAGLVYWTQSNFTFMDVILTPRLSLFIYAGLVPWAIILTFAEGRVTVFPLPQGINEMNNFGCCAQGLVYPRTKVVDLIDFYTSTRVEFADMLTEQYANEHNEQRWALTPSVLQHIGAKSSKPDDFGHGAKYSRSVAGTIWNFVFELNHAKTLREEHEAAVIDSVDL